MENQKLDALVSKMFVEIENLIPVYAKTRKIKGLPTGMSLFV